MFEEESAIIGENIPYVKLHRYNPNYSYWKLKGYRDNGERSFGE